MAAVKDLFPDDGLALAVLDGLMRVGALGARDIEAALDGIATNDYGFEPEQQRLEIQGARADEAIRRLGALDVTEADLAKVDALGFDGGNDIYITLESAIDIDTGGEEDWYRLKSLAGIERLASLRELNFVGYGAPADAPLDLAPLARLPRLARVVLFGTCANAAVLEGLGALEELDLRYASVDDAGLAERLRARGVVVKTAH